MNTVRRGVNGFVARMAVLFLALASNAFAAPWSGTGTVAEPFLIATEADLVALQTQVAAGAYLTSNFLQTANIALTAWSGIGTSESVSFQGVYDGGNKTINAQFDSGKYRGVFAYAKNATIKNLKVNVTGRTGAWGKMKRSGRSGPSFNSGTIGSKSWPSAPRPCSQITQPRGDGPVSMTIGSGWGWGRELMPRFYVARRTDPGARRLPWVMRRAMLPVV